VLRFGSVPGSYGIPLVTQNGQAGGLSRDGRTLVLATYTATGTTSTRFAILEMQPLRVRRIVTLPGSFSYDALSPDAKTLYLIQYSHLATTSQRYRVRAYDLVAGRLLAGVIADKREAGLAMRGYPVARATTADGGWVYTLYGKSDGTAFVHALDAGHRAAICIDLPWRHVQTSIWRVKLALAGSQLVLSQPHGGKLAMIDTRSFAVRALRAPGA
jgi:hypothetical protein